MGVREGDSYVVTVFFIQDLYLWGMFNSHDYCRFLVGSQTGTDPRNLYRPQQKTCLVDWFTFCLGWGKLHCIQTIPCIPA